MIMSDTVTHATLPEEQMKALTSGHSLNLGNRSNSFNYSNYIYNKLLAKLQVAKEKRSLQSKVRVLKRQLVMINKKKAKQEKVRINKKIKEILSQSFTGANKIVL